MDLFEENGKNKDVMTASWLRRQQSHISFIGFQIYQRRSDLFRSYRLAHGSGAEEKGTLVITDEGGRDICRWLPLFCSSKSQVLLCYPPPPLGYSLAWGAALPSASSQHPSQLLCLSELPPLCFRGTANTKKGLAGLTQGQFFTLYIFETTTI